MAPQRQIPSVRLRRLAAELRRLRAAAGVSRERVSARTGVHETTLYRIEKARTRPQKRTLTALLALYGADRDQHDRLLALLGDLTRQDRPPGHPDLPGEFAAYLGFEREARRVRDYASPVLPDLAQTGPYAEAVTRGVAAPVTRERAARLARAHAERRALLTRDEPVEFRAVVDEAALHRPVGGPRVMREQFEHLLRLAESPHVTLRVLPFGAGAHPGVPGRFVLLDFADPLDTDLVYVASPAGGCFLESDADVTRFRSAFGALTAAALDPGGSAALIEEVSRGLTTPGGRLPPW